jgi:hypothetical protein
VEQPRSDRPRRTRAKLRLAGALFVGLATVLQPKADPTEHWATPPRPPVAVQEDPADPDETLDAIDLALLRVDAEGAAEARSPGG